MEETIKFLKEWNKESSERNYNEWREDLRNEGEARGIIEIVKKLISRNVDNKFIMEVTNIDEEELNKIKKSIMK